MTKLHAVKAVRYAAPDASAPAIAELLAMHTYCRPAGGKAVKAFCAKYLDGIPGMAIDKAGNRILRVGTAPVLWSGHTDTVHKRDGMQGLTYGDGILTVSDSKQSSCLGADDSAGVWLMLQMIRAGIEGLYIFHDSEEVGGLGSQYIAQFTPELLADIDYAIAFDRRGVTSVVTHQFGMECCSPEFADALAGDIGGRFCPDDGGTFTDTANYTGLIPECTNLSVGYSGAHSSAEALDVGFLVWLLERLMQVDVATLPVMRNPADASDLYADPYGNDFMQSFDAPKRDIDLHGLVYKHPEVATKILADMGITSDIFKTYLGDERRRSKM